jgi:glutamate N-acetyltransferase/amino-acid N-acetyltransferase
LGYRYAATYAGIRKVEKDDLALIVSEKPAAAAAIFTTNRVQAAPVRLARENLKGSGGQVKAILVNAGNANCATRTGDKVAQASCRAIAKLLRTQPNKILPASTGVIGVELDGSKIVNAAPALVETLDVGRFPDVARAIMTTDTRPKVAFHSVNLRAGEVRFAGMTKGAGMIMPNMATTLGFVMTDAAISPVHLRAVLRSAADRSFHCLSVDGDTSTNDTVAVLANGASGIEPSPRERKVLEEVLCWVMEDLAEQIASDGEGARKVITIRVLGAKDRESANRIGRAIANSPLVKTAIAGSDPNWGRIISAAGYSGVAFDPSKVDIHLQGTLVCRGGLAAPFDEDELKEKLDKRECSIKFVIGGSGEGEARFWTCDLTEDYIRINGSYRT